MLPTFVIGLREGLEASLIVSIVAAFLRQRGRSDLLRWVFAGVAAAIALCVAVGITLEIISRDLPQRQQEGLETVVGAVAVAMVTYMVVWMRRHSRDLKGQLEGAAGLALAAGSGWALVGMAFLAVLREGFETVVFLLAAFNETSNSSAAGAGALLGIVVAVGLGYAIYRGGVRLNLSKFFRATGVVLVLVAGGLVVTAFHTAHEAGWLTVGQQSTVDLTWLVRPGSVEASLLTGMLGVQPKPVLIELIGWLVYVIPVGLYVAWPPGKGPSRASVVRAALVGAAASAVAAIVLALTAPGASTTDPVTAAAGTSAQVVSRSTESAVVRTNVTGTSQQLTLARTGDEEHGGVSTSVYSATSTGQAKPTTTMSLDEVATLNGGRVPLGVRAGSGDVSVSYPSSTTVTAWIDAATGRVVDLHSTQKVTTTAAFAIGASAIGTPSTTTSALPSAAVSSAARAVRAAESDADRAALFHLLAIVLGVLAAILFAIAAVFWLGLAPPRHPSLWPWSPLSVL